jgi:hypothetical protein
MTTSEMITLFKLKYDAASSLAAPDWLNSDIIGFLNDAQETIVDMLYYQGNLNDLSEIFEYVETALTAPSYSLGKSSLEYRFHVKSYSTVNKSFPDVSSVRVDNIYMNIEQAMALKPSIDNKPMFNNCIIYEDLTNLHVMGDAYTTDITRLYLTYVKNPPTITTNNPSALSVKLHQKIVDVAVEKAVQSIYKAKVPPQTKQQQE